MPILRLKRERERERELLFALYDCLWDVARELEFKISGLCEVNKSLFNKLSRENNFSLP